MKLTIRFCLILASLLTGGNAIAAEATTVCKTFEEAQTLHRSGNDRGAMDILRCLKQAHPESVEVRRLLSDVYWWDGFPDRSTAEANDGYHLMSLNEDFDSEPKFHLSDRVKRFRVRGNFNLLSSDSNTGQSYSVEVDDRYLGKNHIGFGIYHTTRIYTGNVEVSDWKYGISHIWALGLNAYWENRFEYSPNPTLSARYGIISAPHYLTSDGSDFSLGMRYNYYITGQNVYTIGPGWNKFVSDRFQLGVQEYSIYTFHWIYAAQAAITYHPDYRSSVKGGIAFGHAVEGPGLEGGFRAIFVEVGYRISERISMFPNANIYRGTVRNENAYGLSAEVSL